MESSPRIHRFGGVSPASLPVELVDAFRSESNDRRRATALRALVAREIGARRSGSGAAELVRLLESCATDAAEATSVREAAILGLVFVSLDRARRVLPPLLESSPQIRARSVDLLEAVMFLGRASSPGTSNPVADELRNILAKHTAELVADPAASPESREKGRVLLKLSP